LLFISVLFLYSFFSYFSLLFFFFFNDTATTEIYTLSLHDALPILTCRRSAVVSRCGIRPRWCSRLPRSRSCCTWRAGGPRTARSDRKSTRLNSSHVEISYAVFCLKKKKKKKKSNQKKKTQI